MNEDPPKGRNFFEDSLAPSNEVEAALRPPSFEDFTGQPKTIERMQVMVGAAAKREEALEACSFVRSSRFRQNHLGTHYWV